VRFEQPLISHRINQAYQEGAKILAINPMDYAFIFGVDKKIIVAPTQLVATLKQVVDALSGNEKVSADIKSLANTLKSANKKAIFLGEQALHHAQAAQIRALAQAIAELSGASLGLLTEGANSAGAWLAGALPHRGAAFEQRSNPGFDAKAMLSTNPLKAYFLMNFEPELDCAYPADALKALKQADCVVCLTPYVTDQMELYADILLPITPFAETGGTYVNVEGRWQSFVPVSVPETESQPAWKILRLLGNLFEFADFEYKTVNQIHHELKQLIEAMPADTAVKYTLPTVNENQPQLTRLAPWPMYRIDNIVRRSQPLQAMVAEDIGNIAINSATAAKLNLQSSKHVVAIQNNSRVTLPLVIDERLADDTVLLSSGLEQTLGFGQAEAKIVLERASE
jgi:NADH-quinone oxidoreductase subunit G